MAGGHYKEKTKLIAEWQVGQMLWSLMWFTLIFMWIMLVIRVFADIFRDHTMGGFAKTLWILFVIVAPFLGVFVYLIARGQSMAERDMKQAQDADAAMQSYIRTTVSTASPAEELEKLAALKAAGTISDAEFETLKAKALS